MSKTHAIFILIALLIVGSFSPCSAQRFRERGGQPLSLGASVIETPADSSVKGALVQSVVEGGLGDNSGLQEGDIIVSIAGTDVKSAKDVTSGMLLIERLNRLGKAIEISIVRDGNQIVLPLKMSGTGTQQSKGPKLGVAMKNAPKEWGVEGVLVSEVAIDSPADEAGIILGDIITAINGKTVKTKTDIQSITSTLKTGWPYKISIRRGSQDINTELTLRDDQATANAKRRLSDMNVLKYAIIDPQSRVITLLGKYDPAYKTGPIPYYELLKDAIQNPYPYFTLEPTDETRSGIDRIHASIGADVQRMYSESDYCNAWAMKLLNLILTNPDLKKDKARFIKKGAEAFKITDDEMYKILAKSAGDSSISSDDIIPIVGKLLCGIGYDQVGKALMTQSSNSSESLGYLGIQNEMADLIKKYNSGELSKDQVTVQATVLIESAVLRGLNVPENEITSRANKVLNGRMSPDEFLKYAEDQLMAIVVDQVGLKMFNGLTLSHEVLCKLYNVQTPQMQLVFKDVSADSMLGNVLYQADYTLKSICTSPEVKNSIPDFLTEMDYMYDTSVKNGTRIPGDAGAEIGHRLVPGEVKMRVSPSGTVVSFDDAQVKIKGWVIKTAGKNCTKDVAKTITNAAEGYGDYLTQNYESLSKVYPELHQIREAEKLIALARWAKTNNYSIVVDKASGAKLAQSPSAVGFWLAVFTADKKEFSLSVIAEGGADFGQNEGDAWVQPTPSSEVTSDVSKQLVMSAVMAKQAANDAIGGNMEAARDMAEKSARAMTGDIDLTQLPSLDGSFPVPSDPSQTAVLSKDAISAVDENMRAIENAKVTMQKAAELEKTSPTEAAAMREQAEAQQQQANANLKSLRDAMDSIRQDPAKIGDAVATIHGLGKVVPPSNNTSTTNTQPTQTTGQTTVSNPKPAKKDDLTPEQRKKLIAELTSLQNELEKTKEQFSKLNKSIQQDKAQFEDWGKVANEGMEKCRDVFYSLLMDASAGALSDRYSEMHELAEKLPDHPQDYIDKLKHIKNWFTALKYTQALKDVNDMAARDGKTLPELLEEVRDDLNIIIGLTPLDKTALGASLKYFSNISDMSYSFAQFCAAYDGIEQMDKNNESYKKAVESLTARMQLLVKRIKEIKSDLGE